MSESGVEQENTIGVLNPSEQYGLIDGLVNHEAKALVAGVVAEHPDQWFDARRIYREIKGRQTGYEGWVPSYMTGFKYCANTLGPMGVVVKGASETDLGIVDAYKATELGETFGLATVGAVSEWSLDTPEVSVQQLFSGSQSRGDRRAPSTRYVIFKCLLEDGPQSYGALEKAVASQLGQGAKVDRIFQDPANEDIFQVITNLRSYNPVFRIENPDYQGNKGFEGLGDTTRAVYMAMQRCAAQGIEEISLDDLVNSAALAVDGIAKSAIRRRIVDTSPSSVGLPGLVWLNGDGRKVSKETQSLVSLQDSIEPAVADLIQRLEAAWEDEYSKYRRIAKTIVSSPETFASIMDKAKSFSPNYLAQTRRQSTDASIIEVLNAEVGLSTADIQGRLIAAGYRYKKSTINVALKRLVEAGDLHFDEVFIDDDKNVTHRVYSPR